MTEKLFTGTLSIKPNQKTFLMKLPWSLEAGTYYKVIIKHLINQQKCHKIQLIRPQNTCMTMWYGSLFQHDHDLFVWFVVLSPPSTVEVVSGRSVILATLFPETVKPVHSIHSFIIITDNFQGKNDCRNIFITKSSQKIVLDDHDCGDWNYVETYRQTKQNFP